MFNVIAFDQAGNKQAAIWNVNNADENATEEEVKSTVIESFNAIL